MTEFNHPDSSQEPSPDDEFYDSIYGKAKPVELTDEETEIYNQIFPTN